MMEVETEKDKVETTYQKVRKRRKLRTWEKKGSKNDMEDMVESQRWRTGWNWNKIQVKLRMRRKYM